MNYQSFRQSFRRSGRKKVEFLLEICSQKSFFYIPYSSSHFYVALLWNPCFFNIELLLSCKFSWLGISKCNTHHIETESIWNWSMKPTVGSKRKLNSLQQQENGTSLVCLNRYTTNIWYWSPQTFPKLSCCRWHYLLFR